MKHKRDLPALAAPAAGLVLPEQLAQQSAEGSVATIVKRRAALAGLQGDFGAHSLRSGFVTEAG